MSPWLDRAIREYGYKEILGDDHEPRIIDYHKWTVLEADTDEIPWCAAFFRWAIKRKGSALARSLLVEYPKIKRPYLGCGVVLKRGLNWQGHCGFFIAHRNKQIYLLAGNQRNMVNIVAWNDTYLISFLDLHTPLPNCQDA